MVTGGTGLVGSHLLFSLASSGEKPKAIYRKTSNLDFVRRIFGYYSENAEDLFKKIEWIEADILAEDDIIRAVKGCSQVYHCAAIVSFDSSRNDEVIRNNTSGTTNIVRSCLGSGDIKLCHVSSTAALGASDGGVMVNEDNIWDDTSIRSSYALSKHLSEEVVWNGIRQGLKAVIVNPSVILGPGDWSKGSSSLISAVDRGMLFYTNGVTGYVDIRDVVTSMMTLMNSPVSGERFIVSSENLSYYDLFRMISNNLVTGRPFIPMPKAMLYPALVFLKILSLISGKRSAVTSGILNAAFSKVSFDNSRIIRTTGIKFRPVNESLKDIAIIYNREKHIKMYPAVSKTNNH